MALVDRADLRAGARATAVPQTGVATDLERARSEGRPPTARLRISIPVTSEQKLTEPFMEVPYLFLSLAAQAGPAPVGPAALAGAGAVPFEIDVIRPHSSTLTTG